MELSTSAKTTRDGVSLTETQRFEFKEFIEVMAHFHNQYLQQENQMKNLQKQQIDLEKKMKKMVEQLKKVPFKHFKDVNPQIIHYLQNFYPDLEQWKRLDEDIEILEDDEE